MQFELSGAALNVPVEHCEHPLDPPELMPPYPAAHTVQDAGEGIEVPLVPEPGVSLPVVL